MALKAAIDIGTNTILLLIAEVKDGKIMDVIEDHVRVVRLGQGVDQLRIFHPEAMKRARACFADYAKVIAKYPGISCKAVATSGSRDARNSAEFFREIQYDFKIPIEIISGVEEAQYSFFGGIPSDWKDIRNVAVLDIGGGSSELVGLQEKDSLFRFSFDMGCVRMTERFLQSNPPSEEEITILRGFVRAELGRNRDLFDKVKGRRLIGVAGTATYLASSDLGLEKFDPARVQGHQLTKKNIIALTERLRKLTSEERLGIGGMDKGRADVIIGGAIILEEILEAAEASSIYISTRGLRYGLAMSDY